MYCINLRKVNDAAYEKEQRRIIMKRLVLAEKPSVARDIARVLGLQKADKELYRGR